MSELSSNTERKQALMCLRAIVLCCILAGGNKP